MHRITIITSLLLFMIFGATYNASAVPAITGTATVDSPQLLNWGQDIDNGAPDLTEPTANRLADLHGSFTDCDIVLSSAGNYHMALRDLWYDVYLPRYTADLGIKNWFFTTSPPVTLQQIQNSNVVFGNLSLKCVPQVAVGPLKAINDLKAAGLTDGAAIQIFRNRGNVLLVKKGNPKHIHSIWDLGRRHVRVVTPNPNSEKNTFDNYVGSIYNIALNDDANAPDGWTADLLFNVIFNGTTDEEVERELHKGHALHVKRADGRRYDDDDAEETHFLRMERGEHRDSENKWLMGTKIHHREVPWSIAYGQADVGVLFYHLALDAVRRFPDLFEIIPLGGTIDNPQPMPGNQVGSHLAVRIKGTWSEKQINAREGLMNTFNAPEFTAILQYHGLQR